MLLRMATPLITAKQCRGARGMLELSQSDLADIAGLSRPVSVPDGTTGPIGRLAAVSLTTARLRQPSSHQIEARSRARVRGSREAARS